MKKQTVYKIFALSALLLTLAVFTGSAQTRQRAAADSISNLQIFGEHTVYVNPDTAILNLGTQSKHTDATKAQESVFLINNRLISMLINKGVNEDDIQTSTFSVYPEYIYEKKSAALAGYNVSSCLTVKIKNPQDAGKIMQAAINGGASAGSGISYELADSAAYYNRALILAVGAANVKAQNIADAIGKTALIKNIEECKSEHHDTFIMRTAYAEIAPTTNANFIPGKLRLTARVKIDYDLN